MRSSAKTDGFDVGEVEELMRQWGRDRRRYDEVRRLYRLLTDQDGSHAGWSQAYVDRAMSMALGEQ